MAMRLYAKPDHFKTHKALICASYAGLEIEMPAPDAVGGELKGRIPVLETREGCIFTSVAIARYLARVRRDVGLYGDSLILDGLIDSWLEYCNAELETPLAIWRDALEAQCGDAAAEAKEDAKRALGVLNSHLLHHTYMVCHWVTLADISLCCAIADGFRRVIDVELMKGFTSLMRWFVLCMAQPEIRRVLGEVQPLARPLKVKGGKKDDATAKKLAVPKGDAPKQQGSSSGRIMKAKEGSTTNKLASPAKGAPKNLEGLQVKCNLGHVLAHQQVTSDMTHSCDSCGKQAIVAPDAILRCAECDYDMCMACAQKATLKLES